MEETKGHKASQPGLRGHSHDPEQDLMKQFVVWRKVPNGWLGLYSFPTKEKAQLYISGQSLMNTFRVTDQFNGDAVVWDEPEI